MKCTKCKGNKFVHKRVEDKMLFLICDKCKGTGEIESKYTNDTQLELW